VPAADKEQGRNLVPPQDRSDYLRVIPKAIVKRQRDANPREPVPLLVYFRVRNNLKMVPEESDLPLKRCGAGELIGSRDSVVKQHHATARRDKSNERETPGGEYKNAGREASRSAKPRATHVLAV